MIEHGSSSSSAISRFVRTTRNASLAVTWSTLRRPPSSPPTANLATGGTSDEGLVRGGDLGRGPRIFLVRWRFVLSRPRALCHALAHRRDGAEHRDAEAAFRVAHGAD